MLGVGTAGPLAQGRLAPAADGASAGGDGDPYGPERDAWAILAAVDRLGPVAFAALLARFGTGAAILEAAAEHGGVARLADTPSLPRSAGRERRHPVSTALAEAIVEATATAPLTLARLRSLGIRVITAEEPAYPPRLAAIAMPPHVLFVRGDAAALRRRQAVAVVGTRRATTHGRTTASRIASALVAADATVVSGLAYGIDGSAHEAAVRAGGITVAVIGGGHASAIPTGHRQLSRAIVGAGGAVVSESAPDVEPTSGTFPRRNRIISGLADATVVVEAPPRSGALITASWALEQGRECFLVPGPLDAQASSGCLSFLREFAGAARLVAGIPQLIADLGLAPTEAARGSRPSADALSGAALLGLGAAAAQVAGEVMRGVTTVDEIVATTDLPVASVLAALGILEGRGLVAGMHGRYRPSGPLLGERVTARPR
jgi:DNA processing protein